MEEGAGARVETGAHVEAQGTRHKIQDTRGRVEGGTGTEAERQEARDMRQVAARGEWVVMRMGWLKAR